MLSGDINVHSGVVEIESEFRMKLVDGDGDAALEKISEIVESVEMCIIDSNGQQLAGKLSFLADLNEWLLEAFDTSFLELGKRAESAGQLLEPMEV